jgi:dTDP-4-amino-4,6-dideoxygalactose transaminase
MIKFNDLSAQWLAIKDQAMPEIEKLLETSQFILGPQVKRFEEAFAGFCSCDHGIGVSNGTDAIKIAAKALELGDSPRVFMPANTFVATWLAIKEAYPNSQITMVDIDENGQIDTNKLDQYIKDHRRRGDEDCLVVAVHMYGCCDAIDETSSIANSYDCPMLEDASQAHGARSPKGTLAGSVGEIAAFSLYPGKNLGAAGDAGIITTNNEKLAEKCRMLRNYGSRKKYIHEEIGYNNRLDSIQAIILYWKLKQLDEWNKARSQIAQKIKSKINNKNIQWMLGDNPNQVYHIMPVLLSSENRSVFMQFLGDHSIECGIHYPVPIHKMPFFLEDKKLSRTEDYANRMVSLPIHPFVCDTEIDYLANHLNNYRKTERQA